MLITVKGQHINGILKTNAGEFHPNNWRNYANNTGFWILKMDVNTGNCAIHDFFKSPLSK